MYESCSILLGKEAASNGNQFTTILVYTSFCLLLLDICIKLNTSQKP